MCCRFDGERDAGRVLRGDQAADAVQRHGRAVQRRRPRAVSAVGRAAVRGRVRRPGPVVHAVRVDGAVQPVGRGAAHPFAVSGRRGVSVRPAVRPVRDQQRGQEVRGRQRPAVRGAQVLQAAAGAADQPAHRPAGQPGQVQRHVVQLDVLRETERDGAQTKKENSPPPPPPSPPNRVPVVTLATGTSARRSCDWPRDHPNTIIA